MFREFIAKLARRSRRARRAEAARRPDRFTPRLESMEERTVPATFTVNPGQSIQAAITQAASANDGNDIINVVKGTYTGNLVVPNSANLTNLVIQTSGTRTAEGDLATIKATSGAVITVDGETGVTIRRLKIDGAGTQANQGVFVQNGGQATIQSNFIRDINPTAGEGIAVRVGRSPAAGAPTTGTATVSSNTVSGYKDAGIVITNAGSDGTVSSNTVRGRGNDVAGEGSTQNGIEVSHGATGDVRSNTVERNGFRRSGNASAGILLFKAGYKAGYEVASNTVRNNDFGISVIDGDRPVLKSNTATANYYYGIGFDSSDGVAVTTGATVQSNTASNNTGANFGGSPYYADGFVFAYLTGSAAKPISITSNTGSGNRGTGFYYEMAADKGYLTFSSNTASSNGYVVNNVVVNKGNGIEFRNLAVNLSTTAYGPLTVTSNTASGNKGDGLLIENVSFTGSGSVAATVRGNTASSNDGNGIQIKNSTGVVIDGLQMSGSGKSLVASNKLNGILVTNSTNIGVKDFDARLNTLNGFLFENSTGLTVTGNLAGSTSGTSQSNGGNGQNGFSFVNTDSSTVSNNTARLNNRNGILTDANSTGNTLSGNTLNTNNRGNNGSFDANDQPGTGSAPTLNTWTNNNEGTKNKNGIN